MEQIINQKIKKFTQALGTKELRLFEVRNKMKLKKGCSQWVFMNSLRILMQEHFLIEVRKEGRNCFVKLTKNGLYYLKLFNSIDLNKQQA